MTWLLIYTVAIFGVAYVCGHSAISLSIREWIATTRFGFVLALIECPACLSWWLGLGVGLAGPPGYLADLSSMPAFVLAFYSAGSSYILARLTGLTAAPGVST